MEETLKSKLVGEQLSSVEFVQDYLQLHFDGRTITAYVWPEVSLNGETYILGQDTYRDRLCDLIGNVVTDLYYQDKEHIALVFKENKGTIKINLAPNNPEIVSEIAIFNDSLDKTWSVFD